MRVGIGYDVHRLGANEDLILGGLKIPFAKGLIGHSDADVLTHAIIDAILGGLGRKDIGFHFPDSDSQYKGISSLDLLAQVYELMCTDGYQVSNLDTVIVAQAPKLVSYIDQMVENIAQVLHTSTKLINIKATTTERLGFVGREEGIAAQAVVLLVGVEERM